MANHLTVHQHGRHFDIGSFTSPKFSALLAGKTHIGTGEIDSISAAIRQQTLTGQFKNREAGVFLEMLEIAKTYLSKGAQIVYSTRPDDAFPD